MLEFSWLLSQQAVKLVSDLMEGRAELLPVRSPCGSRLAVLNVTRVSPLLDEDRSLISRFDDGIVQKILLHEYDPGRLAAETIFKLELAPFPYTYVTSSFVERVVEAGLTGFVFEEVWSDEPEAAQRREAERAAWRRAHGDDLGFDEDGIHVAHRIVPAVPSEHPGIEASDPRLVEVQARMNSLGIGPDDAPNGVFLTPLQHYSAHGEAYLAALHERLMDCGTQEELEFTLRDIGLDLRIDVFPTGDG
jgi:hypothetical protein